MQTYFQMVEKEEQIKSKVKGTTKIIIRPEFNKTENGQDREKIKKIKTWLRVSLSPKWFWDSVFSIFFPVLAHWEDFYNLQFHWSFNVLP